MVNFGLSALKRGHITLKLVLCSAFGYTRFSVYALLGIGAFGYKRFLVYALMGTRTYVSH
jgi:hypothetical protein